jgi:hypothetical protein
VLSDDKPHDGSAVTMPLHENSAYLRPEGPDSLTSWELFLKGINDDG